MKFIQIIILIRSLFIIAITIEFTSEFGDLPLLRVNTTGLIGFSNFHAIVNISEYQRGKSFM